jgi:glycosyltransferase involved in cell wall biosynthesis
MKEQRVAIVYPYASLDSVPSLHNAAVLLSEHGYLMDIFTSGSPEFAAPIFNDGRINLRLPRSDAFFSDLARRHHSVRTRITKLGAVSAVAKRCWGVARKWTPFLPTLIQVWRLHRRNPYRCVIGVDPAGLLQGNYLASIIRVPLVYYSLELLPSHEIRNPVLKRLKKREISLSRKAQFVIIQDEERARLLAQDNQIPMEKFALVPNSPLGRSGRRPSHYWHQRFGLSSDQRVVLHAGSIAPWTGIEQIVQSVGSWPENWVLVVHSRANAESSDLVKRLRELAVPGRVFFSLRPVARQEYNVLVDGADIGIAFYLSTGYTKFTGQNIQALGLSSGKIADYLRAGLPVIVNQAGSISELLQRERCGIAVESGRDIGEAIGQIAQRYVEYSEQACQVFEIYLDFSRGFQEVIKRIDSLEEETRCQ